MTALLATVRSTCPYCGVGCGVSLKAREKDGVAVKGDSAHPANAGRLCSKGTHLGETVGLADRLLHPMIGGRRAGWSDALDYVARNFKSVIENYGPDAVAFYVSGQLLTEDYYVANKLMKGFIGSANIDTNSRLCMASAVAGHKRAFGEDIVPGCYEDLDLADLVILVGSNTAWCHPVLFQRIVAARETRGTKVVVIDPRRTETCENADLHLAIKPGTDVALFNGLLAAASRAKALDQNYLEAHLDVPEGYWQKLEAAYGLENIARICDVPTEALSQLFEWFVATPRTVTAFSQGVNQSSAGTDKVNAILNCHLATGRIGKPGASPFSITGQPNAMGGREVGGLANQLAAHMNFEKEEDIDRVMRFWDAPRIAHRPGLKAVDMFREVASGRIKALWIMATNPAVSMPELDGVLKGLDECPFIVVSDCAAHTDTLRFANVLLPAAAWGEKDGTVTNSERRISRQRSFRPPAGESKPDWWIIKEVAQRLGYARYFAYHNAASIFREHAALSAFENEGRRGFDIGAYANTSNGEFENLEPFQWPARKQTAGVARLFSDGMFFTHNRRGKIVDVDMRAPATQPDEAFPWILNSGRVRDHWHTMTRTGLSAKLSAHIQEPYVQVHPKDAARAGLMENGLAKLTTRHGTEIFRVVFSDAQRRSEIFCPIHWNQQFSSAGRVGRLINAATDPISGQPEFKHTPVKAELYQSRWQGFLMTTAEPDLTDTLYWTRIAIPGATLFELAGDVMERLSIDKLLPVGPDARRIETLDLARGAMRIALLKGGRVMACLFIAQPGELPSREWLMQQFAVQTDDQEPPSPLALLAGRPAQPQANAGPQICVCFNVGLNTLVTAIRDQKLRTIGQVGEALQAGTNCGSCKPKIQSLLKSAAEPVPVLSPV
jgi:assimilatory nitrate reductase catalytic subunit